ncbi:hypothetical protein K2173_020654 [Erythroxylum novogranatense]|uniref:BZIP domain-containing protein n=1 Tax=Erythroxylum novogranatense TaxID=1862640 RepID=A0AAV8TP84_9ROSI|nr:hypothetical protein K2173_020654 [Erythroxylum novogranatense]
MNSSAIEYIANASRDNHSQMEVFTQLENNMQDLGLLQQRSTRGRRKRCNETPEETARRAEEKKIKNRVSAARSRAKTNEHINNLESKVEQLKRDNELLERKIKFQVEMIKEDEEKTKAEKTRETSNRLRRAFSSSF